MKLSWNEIQQRAIVFSGNWKKANRERGQAQLFLDDFFQVFGVSLKRLDLLERNIPVGEGKHCDYIFNTKIESAFVSTNSISQGQQPAILWKPLMKENNTIINFAYRTFKWGNDSKGKKAQVHYVIIGFSDYKNDKEKKIFSSNPYVI